jgi:hypothetical protein
LNVRLFEPSTKATAYKQRLSNYSVCASLDNDNKARIYKIDEMEAGHITA